MSLRGFFNKKRIIWTIIIVLVVGGGWYFIGHRNKTNSNIQTAKVTRQDIEQTVLTTGQVVSALNLNLSFQGSGIVKQVNVISGAKVKQGDILAVLNQANAQAALISAQGALASAKANYQKVVSGATPEQINVSQKAVNAAEVAYNNAVSQLANVQQSGAASIAQAQKNLSDLIDPMTQSDNKRSAIAVTIANQLNSIQSGLDKENRILNDADLKNTFSIADSSSLTNFKTALAGVQPLLNAANASLASAQAYKSDSNLSQAVSDTVAALNQSVSALNYAFSALQNSVTSAQFTQAELDAYKASINAELSSENSGITAVKNSRQALTDALTAAQNAVTNSQLSATQQTTNAQNQVNSSRASLQQAQASLAQLQAKAQLSDINAAKAQILSAQGQVDAAQATFDNNILKAPADGTITTVDTKVGEQANAMQEVMVLQDINALHAEAYVSEANVANLKVGQSVDYTFDALGPDRHFSGHVLTIDPASTVISGVVDYLVKADFPNIPEIKPGMTANMTIMVAQKKNVLAVMSSAILTKGGAQYVRIVDNPQTKAYHEVQVQTGLQADGGLVEITSGLDEGVEIVTYIKQ